MIRVLLADDEELIRVAVAALLGLEPDLEVVAQAGDGREAVRAALAHRPDVAVVDLQMPLLDGFEVTASLASSLPSCAVVILTGRGKPPHLQRALSAGGEGIPAQGVAGRHAGRRDPAGARWREVRRPGSGGGRADHAAVPVDAA